MAEVTQLKRYDAPRINWVNGFDWYGRAGFCSHPCGTDNLYFRAGVQQRDYARAGKPADPDMLHAIWLTVLIALITVPVTRYSVRCWPAGDALYLPGRQMLLTLLDIPFAVSPVVAGLVYLLFYGSNGPLGGWLDEHNLQVMFARPGMVLVTIFVTCPFVVRELVPVMLSRGATKTKRLCCWARQAGRCSAASRCRIFAGHCSMGWC